MPTQDKDNVNFPFCAESLSDLPKAHSSQVEEPLAMNLGSPAPEWWLTELQEQANLMKMC